MEKIAGPFKGCFVATYAWPTINGIRFTSYAKICRVKPGSYWDAQCLVKIFGGEHHATAVAALAIAELLARERIDDLPSFECSTFGLGMPYVEGPSATRA